MNKKAILALATLASCNNAIVSNEARQDLTKKIVLEQGILALVDGSFFNANTIEMLLNFRQKIIDILDGDRIRTVNRIGKYIFNGKRYSVRELQIAQSEKQNQNKESKKLISLLLEQAKKDLVDLSGTFREMARGSQKITSALIKDSCAQRGRTDSLLLIWGAMENPSEKEESKIFENHVKDFDSFINFATDLHNFLTDVINSCPKAQMLFKERVNKFNKINTLLPKIIRQDTKNIDKIAFLTHLKKEHLDNLPLEAITEKKMLILIKEFIKLKKTMDNGSN